MHLGLDHIAQPLGRHEAEREILQVERSRHHHRIADAVDLNRDRHLRRKCARHGIAPAIGCNPLKTRIAGRVHGTHFTPPKA